jgi:putative FmdB family regulatory protein
MPIYEYQCEACGHHLAKLQKMADVPLTTCPVCQQPALNRLLSAPGFRFKVGTRKEMATCERGGCVGCPASGN